MIKTSEDEEEDSVDIRGYLTMLGGLAYHLVVGSILIWGNISTYIISYFRYTTKDGSIRGQNEPDLSAKP